MNKIKIFTLFVICGLSFVICTAMPCFADVKATVSSGGTVSPGFIDLKGEPVIGEQTTGGTKVQLGWIYLLGGGNPTINLTVLLEGLIGKTATVQVEARSGADVSQASNVVAVCDITLDANGNGTNNAIWANNLPPPSGNYYLVIKQKIPNVAAGPNHLPVIIQSPVSLSDGTPTNIDLTGAPGSKVIYSPAGKVSAMKTLEDGRLAMRAGNLSGDKIIDVSDYSIWKGAVTPQGAINQNDPNSVISDINGDNLIDISDYSLWKATVQAFTPNGQPQTGDHIYVP